MSIAKYSNGYSHKLNGWRRAAGVIALSGVLASCSNPEVQSALKATGLDNIQSQGCALGGLGGAIAGGVIGNQVADDENRTQGTILGATIGAALGGLLGCSVGNIIEERRAKASNDADFYDQQIALSQSRAKDLRKDNQDMRNRIAANDKAIKRLNSSRISLAERKRQASQAYEVNSAALKNYNELSDQIETEIEVQETVLAEIRDVPGEGKRAKKLETQIAALKEENAELEANNRELSAQNDRIGAFR